MKEIITFDLPTRMIIHFASEEGRPMTRQVYFQVEIDPENPATYSPSGEFVRFNHSELCEVHGWVKIEEVVVDEILEEYVNGEWSEPKKQKSVSNG